MPSRSLIVVVRNKLPPSLLAERVRSVADIYAEADESVNRFASASGIGCPFGCGSCCETFVPDILPAEAEYLAAWLAETDLGRAYELAGKGLAARLRDDGREGCPLYAADTPYHCTVYAARPLICRMFAFSSTRDKLGRPTFAACSRAETGKARRKASGEELSSAYGAEPPVMADFGAKLAAIDPSSASVREELPRALSSALAKVLFLVGLPERDPSNDGPGAGPEANPPLPRAS